MWLPRLRRFPQAKAEPDTSEEADDLTAELDTGFWNSYTTRMADVRFSDVARKFPALVGQSVRLAWSASRTDTIVTVVGNIGSGFFAGYGLFATTGVLSALFAEGPTPHRVRAALPSLVLVALAAALRSGISTLAGWAQARLEPRIDRAVEMRLYDLAARVELSAFDDPDFHDHLQRARMRGVNSASRVVDVMINWLTALTTMASAVIVVAVLNPLLLVVLLIAELPGVWSSVRSARIGYVTRFALISAYRRQYIFTDLIASRHTAAEMRSFTMRGFLMGRLARVTSYVRDAELAAAQRQTMTRVAASMMGGVATAGVYVSLGALLVTGLLPLSAAGTAVLAIRQAGGSLQQMLTAVNRCYEEGLYFSDYTGFCEDAVTRIRADTRAQDQLPDYPERIAANGITFTYPGASDKALDDVSLAIGRGELVAFVGENGSGKTTLAKILAGLYQPQSGTVTWDDLDLARVDPEALRERIAVIAQDHENWPLTVRQNIIMSRGLDKDRLASAVELSEAAPVIDELARGLDTLLARQFKDGAELSGGQWQRIAAARGFYRAAPLLIMDEPTAALDARAEYALFSSLRTLAETRTVIVITHRLASVRHADRIYVLDHGKVTESGTHSELMNLNGQYADLYTLQASQYDGG